MKPLLSIWISPVKTFEFLSMRDDSENRKIVNVLAALITIGVAIPRLNEFSGLFENNKIIGLILGIIFLGLQEYSY